MADAAARQVFTQRRLVTMLADLAGFTRAVAGFDALRMADLVAMFYERTSHVVAAHGGCVVKFGGDSCLATFPDDGAVDAVDAAIALAPVAQEIGTAFGIELGFGANIHLSTVADGAFGPPGDERYDVIGAGVTHTFRMGGGPGIRITEPVYRQLPSERRTPWTKQRPPALYTYSS